MMKETSFIWQVRLKENYKYERGNQQKDTRNTHCLVFE